MTTFKSNDKFNKLLYMQRHECREKRQSLRTYGLQELYTELLQSYQLFEKYLPIELNNVLDIGCGLGYIDIILSHKKPIINFYMFDAATSNDTKVYLFYNDLNLTKEFLILNQVPEQQINLIDATSTGTSNHFNANPEIFKNLPAMDLIISTYAWGWHSKISKYIKEAAEVLSSQGLLVIEVKGIIDSSGYMEDLDLIKSKGFETLETIQMTANKYLLIAKKL